jgi:hypothetical protein
MQWQCGTKTIRNGKREKVGDEPGLTFCNQIAENVLITLRGKTVRT